MTASKILAGLTPRRRVCAVACTLVLAVASAPAAVAAQAPARGPASTTPSLPATSAIEELAGRDIAVALRGFSATPRALKAAAERIAREAGEMSAAGSFAEAGRRFEVAAVLLASAGGAAGRDSVLRGEVGSASANNLLLAAGLYLQAADTARALRTYVTYTLAGGRLDFVEQAGALAGSASNADLTRMMLGYEAILRASGEPVGADSVLLTTCRSLCASLTNDVRALPAALQAEMASEDDDDCRCGPVRRAVRHLLVDGIAAGMSSSEMAALGLFGNVDAAVDAAATKTVAAGRPVDAAELHLAHAAAVLPDRRFAGAFADASEALEATRASIALRPADDMVGRARTLSIMALAFARMGQGDSATLTQREAERLAAAAPAALRAQIRRRAAVIAAVARDSIGAQRLLVEAVALRGTDGALAAAYDRHAVARALVDWGGSSPALVLARQAHDDIHRQATREDAATIATTLAEAYRLNGMADSATRYFRIAAGGLQKLALDAQGAHVILAMSEGALEAGRLAEAQALFDEAAVTARRSPREDPGLAARLLNDHGLMAFASGNTEVARQAFARAESLATASHPEFGEARRGIALIDAARAKGREGGALTEAARSAASGRAASPFLVALTPSRPPVRPLSAGWLAGEAARLHLERGELTDAYIQARDALALLGGVAHPASLRRVQGTMAALHARLGRADSSTYYRRLAAGEVTGRNEDLVASEAPGRTAGRASGSASAPPAAPDEGTALRAELRLLPERESLRLLRERLAASRTTNDLLREAQVLGALGHHHLRRRSPSDPATATAFYDSAFAALRKLSGTPRAWSEQANAWVDIPDWVWVQIAEQSTLLQGEAVLAWLARSRELGPRAAAMGALAAADRGRGQASATLARGRRVLEAGMAADIMEASRWEGDLPDVGEDLARGRYSYGRGPATLSFLLAGDTLVTWLYDPGSADRGVADTIHVVRRALSADSLASIVSDARASLGADSAATREVPELEPPAPSRGAGARGARSSGSRQAFARLSGLLLPANLSKILAQSKELVVVASGPLAAVPMAALPIDTAGTPLGAIVALRYAPSLSARGAMRRVEAERLPASTSDSSRAARRAWLARALVVGNPAMPAVTHADGTVQPLAKLPGAEVEARAVAQLMGVQPLTGSEATVAAVAARAAQATVIHLATHGYAFGTERRVADSFVALAPAAGDDGLLTVAEVLGEPGLRMPRAELVVLSACQTGLGQMTTSEGTLGLQRAFLASGAQSVLVSLWSVSDEATALLLQSFYKHWLGETGSPSKAEALRRAQDDVRRTPRFADPRFWAAFQLVGND